MGKRGNALKSAITELPASFTIANILSYNEHDLAKVLQLLGLQKVSSLPKIADRIDRKNAEHLYNLFRLLWCLFLKQAERSQNNLPVLDWGDYKRLANNVINPTNMNQIMRMDYPSLVLRLVKEGGYSEAFYTRSGPIIDRLLDYYPQDVLVTKFYQIAGPLVVRYLLYEDIKVLLSQGKLLEIQFKNTTNIVSIVNSWATYLANRCPWIKDPRIPKAIIDNLLGYLIEYNPRRQTEVEWLIEHRVCNKDQKVIHTNLVDMDWLWYQVNHNQPALTADDVLHWWTNK